MLGANRTTLTCKFMICLAFCLVVLTWIETGYAQGFDRPVYIPDPVLKASIEEALGLFDPTPSDMEGLESLEIIRREREPGGIRDLTGLEYATNLHTLWLREHEFSDIDVVAYMPHLSVLHLSRNDIYDLTPLAGLTQLEYLDLHANRIRDIDALGDLTNLTTLILRYNDVSDIEVLRNLTNLAALNLQSNAVSDISAVEALSQLELLNIVDNSVEDLSPLVTLTHLNRLHANRNHIQNLAPLAELPDIQELDLFQNWIDDISPLVALTGLNILDLRYNTLNPSAYCSDLQSTYNNNPDISLDYDYRQEAATGLAASQGTYTRQIQLTWSPVCNGPLYQTSYRVWRAKEDQPVSTRVSISDCQTLTHYVDTNIAPGVRYRYWVGTCASDPTRGFDVFSAASVGWSRTSLPLYVNSQVSDPCEDGTMEHPYNSIQEAISAAPPHATIYISGETFHEDLRIEGKTLQLTGRHPDAPNHMTFPVLVGNGTGPLLLCRDTNDPIRLEGLVLTCHTDIHQSALQVQSADLMLKNCLVAGIHTSEPNLAIIHIQDSTLHLANCTLTDNRSAPDGDWIRLRDSRLRIANSILWNNTPNTLVPLLRSEASIAYSIVPPSWTGTESFSLDPQFARPGQWIAGPEGLPLWNMGDYHLRSRRGRWNPTSQTWLVDPINSPGIDRGDPNTPLGDEHRPHGNRINLGVYGGTSEASLTPPL